jgi:mono/diheme cytochrome c family protein
MRRLAHVRLPAFGAALLAFLWLSPASAQDLPELRSALAGVYTEEQAAAGEELYKSVCSRCHSPTFPIWGPKFQGMWMTGGSLWKLYEFVSIMMPGDNGGSLDPEQYRAAVAYILKINGYPAGTAEIPETPLDIAFINLDPPPGPTTPPRSTPTSDAPADGAR